MADSFLKQNIQNIPLFFIIGRSRSGTTLLMTLFDAHPHVIIPFESPYILVLSRKYKHLKYWRREQLLSFFHDLQHINWKFDSWGVDREKLKNDLLSLEGETDFQTVCRVVQSNYISVFDKKEIKLIGDKNPKYSVKIKEIFQLFPDSKYIHIVRDYRDHLYSMLRVGFLDNIIPQILHQWIYSARSVERMKKKHPKNFHFLTYEDLASNPQETFKKICDFLEIEFKPEVFEFYKKKDEISKQINYSDFARGQANLFNPVDSRRMNLWKEKLNDEEVKLADFVAGSYAKRYGYKKVTRNSISTFKYYFPRIIFIRAFYFYQAFVNKLPKPIRKKLRKQKTDLAKAYYKLYQKDKESYFRLMDKKIE